jgi:Fe-S cluster assembly iron-binding protein IscA
VLRFTDRATDALATFHTAAARWNPGVRLRLVRTGAELRPELADEAAGDDVELEVGDVTVFVPPDLDGVVDAGEHNVLTVTGD